MARPLRIEYPGAFYHVTSIGSYANSCPDIVGRFKILSVFIIL